MSLVDAIVALILATLLIVGGYQIYFLPQKYPIRHAVQLMTKIDDLIPFRPGWVWIYSFFYYPFILSVILTLANFRHFAYVALSFIGLLVLQFLIAYFFPVKTPAHWRHYDPKNTISERFLAFVHKFDEGGNCFPSMHVGVAVLSALHIYYNLAETTGTWAFSIFVMPLLISISTVFTKQHFLVDIPAGAALAIGVFSIFVIAYF